MSKQKDLIDLILSGNLSTKEGDALVEKEAGALAEDNSRLVRVLEAAGFQSSARTALMLFVAAILMAGREGKLLGALLLALKVCQLGGEVPSGDAILKFATEHPENVSNVLRLFLGDGDIVFGSGLPELKRRMAQRGIAREPEVDEARLFPWLRSE